MKEKTFYDILNQDVGRMGFSIRVLLGCQRCEIKTVIELILRMRSALLPQNEKEMTDADFLFRKTFGEKSIREISANLIIQGIDWKTIDLTAFKERPMRKIAKLNFNKIPQN